MPMYFEMSDFMNMPVDDEDSEMNENNESGEVDLDENDLEMGDNYIADALAELEKYPDQTEQEENRQSDPIVVKDSDEEIHSEDIRSHPDYTKLEKKAERLEKKLQKIQIEFRKKLEERDHDLKESAKLVRMMRSTCNEMRKTIENTKEEAEDYKRKWQETVSSYVSFQERAKKKRDDLIEMEKTKILRQFLPVIDNLSRPLEYDKPSDSILEGVRMTYRLCEELLADMNIRKMSSVGEKFNPNTHEAMDRIPSNEVPENTVVEELETGYYLGDTVLRPAKVVVSFRLADKIAAAGVQTTDPLSDELKNDSETELSPADSSQKDKEPIGEEASERNN